MRTLQSVRVGVQRISDDQPMPRISEFFGIAIAMYFAESGHAVPHFHVEHGGDVASLAFEGSIIIGSLSTCDARLVREWALAHRHELANNWELARSGNPPEGIAPLS